MTRKASACRVRAGGESCGNSDGSRAQYERLYAFPTWPGGETAHHRIGYDLPSVEGPIERIGILSGETGARSARGREGREGAGRAATARVCPHKNSDGAARRVLFEYAPSSPASRVTLSAGCRNCVGRKARAVAGIQPRRCARGERRAESAAFATTRVRASLAPAEQLNQQRLWPDAAVCVPPRARGSTGARLAQTI